MRMFVAVQPPDHVLEDLEEYVAPRRDAAAFRWTLPETWHVTLAFAEDVPDHSLDEVAERLGAAAARAPGLEVRIAGGAAFPDPTRAKVLVAGVETDLEELGRLAAGGRTALSTAGVSVDGRRFRPHVTLARVHRPIEATRWIRVLDAYRGPAWTVGEIALVASYRGEGPRGRPRHETVATFPLHQS